MSLALIGTSNLALTTAEMLLKAGHEVVFKDTVLPNRVVASHLVALSNGKKSLEMSSPIRGDAEVLHFVVGEQDAVSLDELDLPQDTGIVCLSLKDAFTLPNQMSALETGDEVVHIAHRDRLAELKER